MAAARPPVTALREPVRAVAATPLLPRRHRPIAVALLVVAVAAVAGLAATVWHATTTSFDAHGFRVLDEHIGHRTGEWLLALTSPPVPIAVLAGVVAVALRRGRRDVAVLAVLGPLLCLILTEWVLKPAVDRRLVPLRLTRPTRPPASWQLAFPSGHETGVASAAVVLVVAASVLTLHRKRRLLLRWAAVVWALLAGVGLVRMHWHYATDVLAAVGVSVAVVLGCALVLDRLGRGVSSPGGRSRPRTSRAA